MPSAFPQLQTLQAVGCAGGQDELRLDFHQSLVETDAQNRSTTKSDSRRIGELGPSRSSLNLSISIRDASR
jgi:hypothetical protein